jgi:hypothetical protein
VYLRSKSMFLYDLLLNRFKSMIFRADNQPCILWKTQETGQKFLISVEIPHFELFQSALFLGTNKYKKIKSAGFKLHSLSCFLVKVRTASSETEGKLVKVRRKFSILFFNSLNITGSRLSMN